MNPGQLNQKIEIYANGSVQDGYAGTTEGQVLHWSTNASVKQLRSSRTQEANQSPLKQVFSFTVRYRVDKEIANDMLLKWRDNWFIIQGYSPDVVDRVYVKFDAIENNMDNIVEGTPETT